MARRLHVLVPAAGEGRRFHSRTPKVLHPVLGRSLLGLALDAASALRPARLIVVVDSREGEVARAALAAGAEIAVQGAKRGTAAAAAAALALLRGEPDADLLILPAHLPLLRSETLAELLTYHRRRKAAFTVLSAVAADPRGHRRIQRGGDGAIRVLEETGADPFVLAIPEISAGVWAARIAGFRAILPRIRRGASGELECDAAPALYAKAGERVEAFVTPSPEDILPVRTRADWSRAAAGLRRRKNAALAEGGAAVVDPDSTWIDLQVAVSEDAVIAPFTVIEGRTAIGARTRIGPGCHIKDAEIGEDVVISASTVIDGAVLEAGVTVGPFARLRPKTVLRAGAHVGNFVEMKAADFGPGAKAGHLSYLGDSEVGAGVNIGAGTITCNFDGVKKNRTVIEAGAFIGSGSELVAPVRVGRGAYVAAGSVITQDVAPGALAIARGRQVEKPDWAARRGKSRT